ncbi:MAG: hypothetical protein ISS52_04745 [Dehalococcoidia bacterium]|nr:hypothetical protein [Dehalococcoidia bacterium]
MRFACVLVHHLPVQVERTGKVRDRPLVIGGFPFERKRVYDASAEAIVSGVQLGMPLSEAYVLCPEAKFLPPKEERYREVYEQVAEILEGSSPSVETGELGCAFFDATGFEDESRLASEIVSGLFHHIGLRACFGIASNKFLARVAAYVTKPEAPIIVPEGGEKSFLAPFSVDFLPCSEETKKRFNLLGIRIIGQLAGFTKETLVEQFDKDGIVVYEFAHGIDRTPLFPRNKPRLVSDRVHFDAPIDGSPELLAVIGGVLDRFLAELKGHGQVCRKIKLGINFSTASEEVTLGLREATNSHKAIMVRLRSWLEKAEFPEAIDGIDICLEVDEDRGRQLCLLKQRASGAKKLAGLRGLGLKKATVTNGDTLVPERSFKLTDV